MNCIYEIPIHKCQWLYSVEKLWKPRGLVHFQNKIKRARGAIQSLMRLWPKWRCWKWGLSTKSIWAATSNAFDKIPQIISFVPMSQERPQPISCLLDDANVDPVHTFFGLPWGQFFGPKIKVTQFDVLGPPWWENWSVTPTVRQKRLRVGLWQKS